jgi:hypothetical protein
MLALLEYSKHLRCRALACAVSEVEDCEGLPSATAVVGELVMQQKELMSLPVEKYLHSSTQSS